MGLGFLGVGCEAGVGAFGDDAAFSGGWRSPSGMGKLAAEGARSVVGGVVIGVKSEVEECARLLPGGVLSVGRLRASALPAASTEIDDSFGDAGIGLGAG
jgi:hypothetical protein